MFPDADYGTSTRYMYVAYPLLQNAVFAAAEILSGADIATWLSVSQNGIVHGISSAEKRVQRYRTSAWSAPTAFVDRDLGFSTFALPDGGLPGYGIPNGTKVLQFVYPQGQRLVDVVAGTTSLTQLLDGPSAVPSGFIGLQFANGFPITFVSNNGAVSTIRSAAAARNNSGFAMDRKRNRVIWAESTGVAPAADSLLYEAPFVEKEADLVPHRVTAFDDPGGFGGGYMIANNGVAVIRVSNTRVLVTDLTTGASNRIDADPGKWLLEPIWVNDDEVWLAVGTIHGNGADFDSIHRITRASLGAPNIPAQ